MRAFVIGAGLVAVIAAGGWYVWKEKPEAVKALLPAAASEAASVSASPAVPSDAQFIRWRSDMRVACASGDKALHIEQFDVNGDERADTICWRIVKTDTSNPYIDLEARVKKSSGQVQTAYIIVPMTGASEQFGVCGPPEALRVEQARWTAEQFEEMGWADMGRVSIAINGGDCDPPWLFWPMDAKGEDVAFDFARM
jgi:hypothetical protein